MRVDKSAGEGAQDVRIIAQMFWNGKCGLHDQQGSTMDVVDGTGAMIANSKI